MLIKRNIKMQQYFIIFFKYLARVPNIMHMISQWKVARLESLL